MQNKCPKKGVIFVLNSIFNYVYNINHKNKMSTPLHAFVNVVFDNVYFVLVISIIRGQKMRFSESRQTPMSKKSIFWQIEVNFLNV